MVRRLLIALVAVLAFAMPAAAAPLGPAPVAGLEAPCLPDACLVRDDQARVVNPVDTAPSCRVADLGSSSHPLAIQVDPDGCLQQFIRKTIGWFDATTVGLGWFPPSPPPSDPSPTSAP